MAAIPDRTRDSTKSLSILIVDAEEKPAEADNKNEQDAATIVHPRDSVVQAGSFGSGGDLCVYPTNVYAPQAQPFYYRGYEGGSGEWEEYPPYVNAEGLEIGSPGVYNDNRSVLFHSGYGYNPQMPYGPYSPVTTPLPPVGGDAQLYSPQQLPFSGPPYYQQLVAPSMPYVTSPTPVSKPELTSVVSFDQQGDSMIFGQRPVFPPVGSFSRGGFPGGLGFHDSQQGIEGIRSGGIWSDWSKPSDRQRSWMPFSPAVSPQPTGPLGSFGQNVRMASYQQKPFYGFGSGPNSYNSGYLPSGLNQGSSFGGASISSLRANGRNWLSVENSRRYLNGSGSLCSCNGTPDILSEQNRGPRALKPKSQITAENLTLDNSERSTAMPKIHDDLHNRPDFVTEYKEAKFFIIKSYSEDNVHKSIKYGVWASTANGNRKLDSAYHEAQEKQYICPVFLLFSVNASAQFCGVAEMVGSVDFDKSVDYWQQDKWSGQFPVKWHMIKDVPNSQFRHIVLENNDNKPVTNSRDTQEVKLEQGIEMLNIFKNHETDMSILDDFDFYEERQKAMEERKARQQAGVMAVGVAGEHGHRNAVSLSGDFIKQMSKSFAQVVRMDEGGKEVALAERPSSTADGSIGIKLEDSLTIAVSSAHTS